MGPLLYSEHEQNGAIYIAALGTLMTFMTWIETGHSLARGCVAGAIGIGILLAVGALVRARREFE